MVMPSWAPESWNERCRSAPRTVRAAASPSSADRSTAARSTVTSENSAATKNALPAVSSTNANSGSSVANSRPSPRPPMLPRPIWTVGFSYPNDPFDESSNEWAVTSVLISP